MKKTATAILLVLSFVAMSSGRVLATTVWYDVAALPAGRFEYTYEVVNDTLPIAIEQFTIWFSESLYHDLQVTTQPPLSGNWNENIFQSTPFGLPFGYDAIAFVIPISPQTSQGGFAVSVDWLGQGVPASQFYEIVDPSDGHTLDSGYTVPEPATWLLLFFFFPILRRKL